MEPAIHISDRDSEISYFTDPGTTTNYFDMITSMTGFGRGEASDDGIQVTAEIKTLNSRYLDLSVRLPNQIFEKELAVKEIVQKRINRGKVNISLNLNRAKSGEPDVTFNPEMVESYGRLLHQINQIAGISQPVSLRDLLSFEDIITHKQEDSSTIETIWTLSCKAIEMALETVNKMRREEGGQLKNELVSQVTGIESLLAEITSVTNKRAPDIRKKMQERIAALLSDEKIDPARLEMEIALIADKMDINEEIVRLNSHLKFFLEALESEDSVGRRLNFLCQEINRELNTIGSKASDSDISHLVVHGKEKLEQIREQVQNIE